MADSNTGELRRSLGLFDAVTIGLGSMIGAGIFAALGPAARAAGSGLLLGLAVAAVGRRLVTGRPAQPLGQVAPTRSDTELAI